MEWLSEKEETPETSQNAQKVTANRQRQLKEKKDAYKVQSTTNNKTLAIIYNLYNKYPTSLIKSKRIVKGAQERLKEAYKQEGFTTIYE